MFRFFSSSRPGGSHNQINYCSCRALKIFLVVGVLGFRVALATISELSLLNPLVHWVAQELFQYMRKYTFGRLHFDA